MLDAAQVALVQHSWRRIAPIGDTAAQLFYGQMFEFNPSLSALFKNDMVLQGRKLLAMIDTAVAGLDDLATLEPTVQDLGRRHTSYGLQPKDYDSAREALLWTIQLGMGDDFSPELKEAWTAVFALLARNMQANASNCDLTA